MDALDQLERAGHREQALDVGFAKEDRHGFEESCKSPILYGGGADSYGNAGTVGSLPWSAASGCVLAMMPRTSS